MEEWANPWLVARLLNQTFGTNLSPLDVQDPERFPPEMIDVGMAVMNYIEQEQAKAKKRH